MSHLIIQQTVLSVNHAPGNILRTGDENTNKKPYSCSQGSDKFCLGDKQENKKNTMYKMVWWEREKKREKTASRSNGQRLEYNLGTDDKWERKYLGLVTQQ